MQRGSCNGSGWRRSSGWGDLTHAAHTPGDGWRTRGWCAAVRREAPSDVEIARTVAMSLADQRSASAIIATSTSPLVSQRRDRCPRGRATRANPAKAGDAKLRGYHPRVRARITPVEPPPDLEPGESHVPTTRWSVPTIAPATAILACAAPTVGHSPFAGPNEYRSMGGGTPVRQETPAVIP